MSNMSYCRFRNTLKDLAECFDNTENIGSDEELRACKKMIELCRKFSKVNAGDLFIAGEIGTVEDIEEIQEIEGGLV